MPSLRLPFLKKTAAERQEPVLSEPSEQQAQQAAHETQKAPKGKANHKHKRPKKHKYTEPDPHWRDPKNDRATQADEAKLYDHAPGFCDFLPWVEYLPESRCFLLEDNRSVGAVYEILPIGTEGREPQWLMNARDSVEDALQDSFDEIEDAPYVVQFFCQDDTDFHGYMRHLTDYIKDNARDSAFTDYFLQLTAHHMRAITRPGGLFVDSSVTRLPWRGQNRRIRMVIYRRIRDKARLDQTPEQLLNQACERVEGALKAAGVRLKRVDGKGFYEWLLPWFNPKPRLTEDEAVDFYQKVPYPDDLPEADDEALLALPFDHDFAERLFYSAPKSDTKKGLWFFDKQPHSVLVVEKLRRAPRIGQITGETAKGDSLNALFDQVPEDTLLSLTFVVTPQDILESRLNRLTKKAIGENIDSSDTRRAVATARELISSKHKLYRGTLAFYLRGHNQKALHERTVALTNVLLGAGLQPVREGDEIAACNSYLRWLPMAYNPLQDKREWYSRLMFAQHIANLAPVWGRNIGTGHPAISFFNRGGSPVTFDPLSQLDRAMNAHMLIFGPTGAGKSATLVTLMIQMMGVYRPRLFIVEAGNSFGLLGQFFARMGLTVNQVALKPGSGITLAPFADAKLLIERPDVVETLVTDVDELEDRQEANRLAEAKQEDTDADGDDKRDVLGELEIVARLMITGGEAKEEDRLTRADKSLIRRCIVNAAEKCVHEKRTVLTQDICTALADESHNTALLESRRSRAQEMSESMMLFTQGFDGQMFNREGATWPESDVTLVDLGTYAREGYEAQMSISYISLMNMVNNIAERDQYSGRPIIMITDEGHIITKNPLVAPYAVKITKMWRKLGAWFWLATQNLADFPNSAETLLNMIEWWINLVMPVAEVESIAKFKNLTKAQKALLLSASKEPRKFTEGVVLSKNHELMFRTVPPSLFLALAMTEPEEKRERNLIMQELGCTELEAAFVVAERMDKARGIEPMPWRHLFEESAGV